MSDAQVSAIDHQVRSSEWETVQRVVFPDGRDSSLWPLYVDWGNAPSSAALSALTTDRNEVPLQAAPREIHQPPRAFSRRSLTVPAGERLSLASYFNAFPAAYWQHWTDVRTVRLDIETKGVGTVALMRSSARGTFTTIESETRDGTFAFEVPLDRFGDGGWLWAEIDATVGEVELVSASWRVPRVDRDRRTKLTVGITTFNMPGECIKQANRFLSEPEVLERVAEIIIADQGTRNVVDTAGYEQVQEALGSKLRVIRQPNLGGSGGFSRGMFEMLRNPESDYVLLLDDDAEVEPEGVLRAISFADRALRPTIVGGHMLNLNERTILHSMGEKVNPYKFWWESVDEELSEIDLAQRTIRTDPSMNRRVDVNYNGWWMCLIPKVVVEKIGLSLPFFIKWDDAEYGLRAMEHGFPTVSLPGAAVWHVPWTEKDDGLDWQAYFHQRNRWVAALLHSPYPRGGTFPKTSLATDTKHLLSLQYYPERLRLMGLEDVLQGPRHLHPSLLERAAKGRALAADFDDAQLIKDSAEFPQVKRRKPLRQGKSPSKPDNVVEFGLKAFTGALRQLRATDDLSQDHPQAVVTNAGARWWRLSNLDSALVSNAAGSGAWFYHRNPQLFRKYSTRSAALHAELIRNWDRLAREYRAALGEVTSPSSWEAAFKSSDSDTSRVHGC